MSCEQAFKYISDLRTQILSGKQWETVATQKSDCISYSSAGDLKWTPCSRLDPEFVKAALALSFGEISKPVLSPSGWHLIRRLDGVPATQRSHL
jgi:peptidyl-prolyl cis-trans isomerase SurA